MPEYEVRDALMKILFGRIGKPGSWKGERETAAFEIELSGCSGRCVVEGVLSYALPAGQRLDHRSDIQLEYQRRGEASDKRQYIAIEVKHTSAVTDQFKCRAFDMIHLKKELGSRLHAILVFARMGQGLGIARAKAISYSFDDFLGFELAKNDIANGLSKIGHDLVTQVESVVLSGVG